MENDGSGLFGKLHFHRKIIVVFLSTPSGSNSDWRSNSAPFPIDIFNNIHNRTLYGFIRCKFTFHFHAEITQFKVLAAAVVVGRIAPDPELDSTGSTESGFGKLDPVHFQYPV